MNATFRDKSLTKLIEVVVLRRETNHLSHHLLVIACMSSKVKGMAHNTRKTLALLQKVF